MGKIVRGARVAQSTYVLKPPVETPAAAPVFADVPSWDPMAFEATPAPVAAAPTIDLDSLRAEASQIIEDAEQREQAILREAQARADALIAEADARVAQIEADARMKGFEQGVSDGRASAQAEMDEMLETMRGLIEMARIERHKIIEGAEPEILRLATFVAERILHKHISLEPETVLEMARGAISRVVNRESVTVRVNPADLEIMRENRERLMNMNDIEHMRVIEDQRVDRGGVVIETEAGTIDAKVSTQLREVRRLLAVEEPAPVRPSPEPDLLRASAQAS